MFRALSYALSISRAFIAARRGEVPVEWDRSFALSQLQVDSSLRCSSFMLSQICLYM